MTNSSNYSPEKQKRGPFWATKKFQWQTLNELGCLSFSCTDLRVFSFFTGSNVLINWEVNGLFMHVCQETKKQLFSLCSIALIPCRHKVPIGSSIMILTIQIGYTMFCKFISSVRLCWGQSLRHKIKLRSPFNSLMSHSADQLALVGLIDMVFLFFRYLKIQIKYCFCWKNKA